MQEYSVQMKDITVCFPGTVANDKVSLSVRPGEIFALVGENGAGKSTIMNVLYGLITPTEGEVYINGEKITDFSPNTAIKAGVGMVHQHFKLVPSFTVAENIVLGNEPKKSGLFFDMKKAVKITEDLVDKYGLYVDPMAKVSDISVGWQQRVEILKTLSRGSKILILDEPTAVLTPQETTELFDVIRSLARDLGHTVIIITHKLYEVLEISDRVAVMRKGRLIGVKNTSNVTEKELASMMVGRDVLFDDLNKAPLNPNADDIMQVKNLKVFDNRGLCAVKDVSFGLRAGEVLGIAGVEGNGQSELVEAITGMRKPADGKVFMLGNDVTGAGTDSLRKIGLAYVPEDRLRTGLAGDASIADNLIIGKHRRREFAFLGIHRRKAKATGYAREKCGEFDIRTPGTKQNVSSLSGGNMQKVIIGREFSFENTKVLIIAQPTRGIDIGAIEFIHTRIIQKRNEGCAILLISADLDEILRLSDRVMTIHEGRITAQLEGASLTRENIGMYMLKKAEDETEASENAE